MSEQPEALDGAPRSPNLSAWTRAVRIFVRPAAAWDGLDHQVQFWIPLVFTLFINAGLTAAIYRRALLPMILDQYDEAVANGQMQPEALEKISQFLSGPWGLPVSLAQQVVSVSVVVFVIAGLLWFGCGFVLGTRFRFRLALEVVCWASLVRLPETVLTLGIAWFTETLKGIHLGFAALLPDPETPNKLHAGLAVFLDALGPFGIWYLVVAILGASALSGAPRKNVAWILIALYLALAGLFAAVAAAFTPSA
ncbi:MAG: YIP1 family protein [Candidatus Eisenbacteria bacterium]